MTICVHTINGVIRMKKLEMCLSTITRDNNAGINYRLPFPPGQPGAFAPRCVPSPRAFAQQKVPGGRANK